MELIIDKNINEDTNEVARVKQYKSKNYELQILTTKNGYAQITIVKKANIKYLPNLYVRRVHGMKVSEVEIETVSYGALKSIEIVKMINEYNTALKEINGIKEVLKENDLLK